MIQAPAIWAAPGLFHRRLSLEQVMQRIKKRHAKEIAKHNAHVVKGIGEATQPRRTQVLNEFDAATRRLVK